MTFDRGEWLEWRRIGIGASDVAAIVGLSPWQSPYSLWCEKVGLTGGLPETEAMAHGRYAEHAIRAWFEDTYAPLVVGLEQRWCGHAQLPWARCTPDGYLFEGRSSAHSAIDALGLIEFKVSDFKVWEEIPDHYQCQAQWQMFVTRQPSVTFAVMHGKRFARYDLERNDDDIAFLRDAAESFWHDHVLAGVAPAVDQHPATTLALGHRWQASEESIDLDEVAAGKIGELRNARLEEAWWSDRRALLENEIKAALGDASVGRVDGRVAVTWKASTTARLDAKALRAVEPDLAEKFTTVTESRRFLLKGE